MSFADMADAALDAIKNTLGQEVTYNPAVGGAQEILGVFSKTHIEVDPGTGAVLQTENPNLLVKLSDLDNAPTQGDTVEIDGTTYAINEAQKDGQGGVLLFLLST